MGLAEKWAGRLVDRWAGRLAGRWTGSWADRWVGRLEGIRQAAMHTGLFQ